MSEIVRKSEKCLSQNFTKPKMTFSNVLSTIQRPESETDLLPRTRNKPCGTLPTKIKGRIYIYEVIKIQLSQKTDIDYIYNKKIR